MKTHDYPRTLPSSFTYEQVREHYVHLRSLLTEEERQEWDKIATENQGSLCPNGWYSALKYYRETMLALDSLRDFHEDHQTGVTDILAHVAWEEDSSWRDRWLRVKHTLRKDISML